MKTLSPFDLPTVAGGTGVPEGPPVAVVLDNASMPVCPVAPPLEAS